MDQVNSFPDRQQDDIVLSAENGRNRQQYTDKINKENWGISMFKGITITAEYLPSALNQTVGWQSRHTNDSLE